MAYLYKAKIQILVSLAYRFEVFATLLTRYIEIIALVCLWECVYKNQESLKGMTDEEYRKNMEELTEVLGLAEFMDIPVRQLSLGQKMRGELAAAMLHSPKILFLDEPTIGLDIDAKKAIREFILEINKRRNITVILTSHDLEDVSRLCSRLIVINHGVIVRDGAIDEIVSDMAPYRILKFELAQKADDICCDKVQIISQDDTKVVCRFDHHKYTASEIIRELSEQFAITDLSVEEPDIEEAVAQIYHE